MNSEEFLTLHSVGNRQFSNLILNDSKLEDKNLSNIILENCVFREISFRGSSLVKSKMLNVVFVDCNLEGIDATQSSWGNVVFEKSNLSGAIFNRIKVINSIFKSVDLTESFFYGSQLDCSLCDSDLRGVSFNGSKLNKVSFRNSMIGLSGNSILTNFSHCSLREADFSDVRLSGCNLSYADVTDAILHVDMIDKGIFDDDNAKERAKKFLRKD
jgi:uncharacterized protein YjbI with pentapeptide repeats